MSLKKRIKSMFTKQKPITIRKTLTDQEREAANEKFRNVKNAIYAYENKHNIKLLSSATLIEEDYYSEDSYKYNRIDFFGVTNTRYALPLTLFMTLPPERIVIGVTRALMIGR